MVSADFVNSHRLKGAVRPLNDNNEVNGHGKEVEFMLVFSAKLMTPLMWKC